MPSTLDTTPTEMPMTTIPPPSYEAPLWPNYLCLYLEYATAGNPSMTTSHTLAQLPHCFPIPKSSIPSTSDAMKERYLSLAQLNPSLSLISPDATLFAKMKLDLNFNMNDFFFNNTCFFESKDRRMIECTTTIYSFGKVVLESKEMQQALWVPEGKYMYSFVYVNQFFDAFMKGVQSLQSWEEVDIAIHNLCIVQVFEDMEAKCHSSYLVDSNLPTNTSPTSSSSSSATITETTANLQPLESVINENNKDQYQIMMNYPCSPQEPSSSSSSSTSSSTSSATTPASSTSSSSSLSTLFNSTVKNCIHPSITKHGGTGSHLLAVVYEFERGQGTIDMTTIHEDVSQKAQQQQQHHQDTIMS
ncbi:uncharacterized protein BX664DRAFT_337963 [Halteromyces radiatus]|uniref:uncharacterized protein n=1 Tax=Halteromyces radiatus TaxID=101107 RepID=UPI00222006D3|nr:uncharacterized protein BX664DRAFT_337963 [Halteromyces radiatus]KAI8084862.1 hypothetical protein BX664DRAFT_337963 [Halteromyces radiatus]